MFTLSVPLLAIRQLGQPTNSVVAIRTTTHLSFLLVTCKGPVPHMSSA